MSEEDWKLTTVIKLQTTLFFLVDGKQYHPLGWVESMIIPNVGDSVIIRVNNNAEEFVVVRRVIDYTTKEKRCSIYVNNK